MRLAAALLLFAGVLCAQDDLQIWDFPALSYGSNHWSIIRVTNESDEMLPVAMEGFSADGKQLQLPSTVQVPAHDSREIRIQPSTRRRSLCWVRVKALKSVAGGLKVFSAMEQLNGNRIRWVEREPEPVKLHKIWFLQPRLDQSMYLLNVGTKRIWARYCWAPLMDATICERPRYPSGTLSLNPRQSHWARPGKARAKYFVVILNEVAPAVLVFVNEVPGGSKEFQSESTLEFGETLER